MRSARAEGVSPEHRGAAPSAHAEGASAARPVPAGAQAPPLAVTCFGEFQVMLGGEVVTAALTGRQGRALLAYLAVSLPRAVPRDELVHALWPSTPPAAPEAALCSILAKARRALGRDSVPGREALSRWRPERAPTSSRRGRRSSTPSARSSTPRRSPRCRPHSAPWRSSSGRCFRAWGRLGRRRRATASRLAALRALEVAARAGATLGDRHLAAAERAAGALVERQPFREDGYILLMDAQAAGGNAAEALRTFERLRAFLRDELGVRPSPAAIAAHARVLEAEPPRDRPARPATSERPSAAPAPRPPSTDRLPVPAAAPRPERGSVHRPRAMPGAAALRWQKQRGSHLPRPARRRRGRRQDAPGDPLRRGGPARRRRGALRARRRRGAAALPAVRGGAAPRRRARRPARQLQRELQIFDRIFPGLTPGAGAGATGRRRDAALPALRGGRRRCLACAARAAPCCSSSTTCTGPTSPRCCSAPPPALLRDWHDVLVLATSATLAAGEDHPLRRVVTICGASIAMTAWPRGLDERATRELVADRLGREATRASSAACAS